MHEMEINICKDFSDKPGGRYIREGKYSGEAFRKDVLLPKYLEAKEKGLRLIVNLDGGYGYATSFLEEAFGGLVREIKDPAIAKILIISNEEPQLVDDVRQYIEDAIEELGENLL